MEFCLLKSYQIIEETTKLVRECNITYHLTDLKGEIWADIRL